MFSRRKLKKVLLIAIAFLCLTLVNSASAVDWWNSSYLYKQGINITNNNASNPLPTDYSIDLSVDTESLIFSAKLQDDCDDLRIVYWNGTGNIELDRVIENDCNASDTIVWFNTYENIPTGESNSNYSVYYSYQSAGAPPLLDIIVNFSSLSISSYGGSQDVDSSQYKIQDGGRVLHMWGNNWKAFSKTINISSDTIFDFEFKNNDTEGEIHGIGADDNLQLSPNRFFRVYGTQNWGFSTYDNYASPNWKHYLIEVYDEFTGSFPYLTFGNDADAGQDTETYFRNIKIRKYISQEPTASLLAEEAYDIHSPAINLEAPAEAYNTTDQTIIFNFTAVDEASSQMNCSIYLDDVLDQTNSSTVNGTTTTFTISGISEGNHEWYVKCTDHTLNSNTSETRTFTIDLSAPEVNSIILAPSSSDDIDPNVQINFSANLTDDVGIEAVLLQYKADNKTEWSNSSMSYSSPGIYDGAYFTPIFSGIWQYRIWSNDTLGNSGYGQVNNLSVQLDWSWTRSPADLDEASAYIGQNTSLGTITITNTGDYAIEFDLSSNWRTPGGDEKIYYNESEPFTLSPKQAKNLQVSATVSESQRQDEVGITIDAINTSAEPDSLNINATLIAYTSGPFLYSSIVVYNQTVTQSSSGSQLKASVRNLGNETADNVTLHWVLPSGWSSEYSFEQELGNIAVDQKKWSNITVEISSSATTGLVSIAVNATTPSNISSYDSKTITVLCSDSDGVCGAGCTYLTDNDCEQEESSGPATTGGTVGGGVGSGSEYSESQIIFEVVRGTEKEFPITVSNIYPNSTLERINMKLEGFFSQYISISPDVLNGIEHGKNKSFILKINAPRYLDFSNYTLKSTITGKIVQGKIIRHFTDKRTIDLVIQELSAEQAEALLEQAEEDIGFMRISGFSVFKSSKLFEQAENAFEIGDTTTVRDLVMQIGDIRATAGATYEVISIVQQGVIKAEARGLEVPGTKDLLNLALAAFEREDYSTAGQRAKQANLALALETKGKVNLLWALIHYWWLIGIAILALYSSTIFTYKRAKRVWVSKRSRAMKNEEQTIKNLIIDTQNKTFKTKEITPTRYREVMDNYEARLTELKEKRAKLIHTKTTLLNKREGVQALKREAEEIVNLMKETQHDYFEGERITKEHYLKEIARLEERLAEIENETLTLEIALEQKEKSKINILKKDRVKKKRKEIIKKLEKRGFRVKKKPKTKSKRKKRNKRRLKKWNRAMKKRGFRLK